MTRSQHIWFFIFLVFFSAVLLGITSSPFRNYVPVFWVLGGFGLHAYLCWKSWLELSEILVSKYPEILKRLGVNYRKSPIVQVDFFGIRNEKAELSKLSHEVAQKYVLIEVCFQLALLAFAITIVLALVVIYV